MSLTAIGGHGKFSVPEKFLILENFLAPSSIAPGHGQFLLPPGNAVPPIPLVFPARTASAILEMVFHLFHWCWQPGQFLLFWCFTYTPLVFLCLPPGNAVPPLFHWYSCVYPLEMLFLLCSIGILSQASPTSLFPNPLHLAWSISNPRALYI